MMKKAVIPLIFLLLLVITISAQEVDLGISLPKEKFGVGENIGIQVILKDSQGSKINTELNIIFEDSLKNQLTREIMTNNPSIINLGENPINGLWKITATYEEQRAVSWILIEETENATLRLDGNILTIKNTGNTIYSRTVNIVIGEELSTKK